MTIEEMIAAYEDDIFHLCLMYLGDRHLAEDACQETMIKAWKSRDSFRGDSSEKTWLCHIAANVCKSMQRSAWFRIRRAGMPMDTLRDLAAPQASDDAILVRDALSALPDKYREVITLYYDQDMKLREIAHAQSIPVYTAATRLRRARALLKKALLLALLTLLLCGAAFAIAGRWGMLDFAKGYSRAHVPETASESIVPIAITQENEHLTASVRELYYDGRTCRLTVDIVPKGNASLLGWSFDARVTDSKTHRCGRWLDDTVNEDGSMTLFIQQSFEDDLPQRDAQLELTLTPPLPAVTEHSAPGAAPQVSLSIPLMLAYDGGGAVFLNAEPVQYPSVGVRVDRLRIEVKPQELYAIIEYTVTDEAAFHRIGMLWFEFVDPQSMTENPRKQLLQNGMNYSAYVTTVEHMPQRRLRQTQSLAATQLRETYTLRAYDHMDGTRYDAREIQMTLLEKDE